jgi:hypothetical protein
MGFRAWEGILKVFQRLACGLAVSALAMLAPSSANAEVIPVAQMVRGVSMTQTQCAAQALAVWVVVARNGYCIRYYLSTAGGQGLKPVVYLTGDKLGPYRPKTKQFVNVDKDGIDTDDLQRGLDTVSKTAQTTAIHLARPGIDGSSGFHGHRKTWLELYILNAALDAIKRKHAFTGFHLAGQSGGAGLVGGLVVVRDDIECAVAGAGPLNQTDTSDNNGGPLLEYFNAGREIARIAARRSTRFIVITDPEDKIVSSAQQTAFANALRKAGGRVEQHYVQAIDEKRHGVRIYSIRAVAGCVKGENQQQIATALARLQEIRLANAREKASRQSAGATPTPPRPRG